jgi:ribosomal protein L37AE/L43A
MSLYETWTYGICEYCQKNRHEEVKMKREKIVGYNNESKKIWICPNCGSTKSL